MATQCNSVFDELARGLGGFSCVDAPAVLDLRNPLTLSNWTLPVLELMMVAVAVAALWYSIGRLRRAGDPTNLALWAATVVYLFCIEIPLYFPNAFGIEDRIGVVFVHNAFSVQFLFERLPLYIVALYPAVITLAYEIVRSLGVFRDRGLVIGAICVGFVHHCLYEVFDQLGPQLRWWAWNTDNPINRPMLASVPMSSMFIFATLGPVVVTVLVMLLVGRPARRGRPLGALRLSWRTLLAGALVPLGLVVLSIPTSVFGGPNPRTTAQAVIFGLELAVVAGIAIPVLIQQWYRRRGGYGEEAPNPFVRIFGPLYLAVLAGLWLSALPAYFAAVDGRTSDGTPTGSLLYAVVCLLAAALAVAAVALPAKVGPPQTVAPGELPDSTGPRPDR
ncbi:hypothetical protein [Mycolicibacterium palauense]|uniref:hypothetical protein n=1 Tax=Mycolicibacterium palauense TaxID=2034511 RepID=UPI00159BE32D|nr:hypothetical protein [Mycolicibacterium palauense]